MALDADAKHYFKDKVVLVTGGSGSIGGMIVQELLELETRAIRVLSRGEAKQWEMQERLGNRRELRYLIGDVRDYDRLYTAMRDVDIVFHAAAMKHVPKCEYNPFEAVQTNVIGTQNLIRVAAQRSTPRVIAISTDKAMNPVNTMGASKMLAERLVAAADSWNPQTTLACVRFGNVLGSDGSVVPGMIQSILTQGVVRITDPAMTRFMMTIKEAVHLTIKAATQARGGEIFIFKMPALKLADLVEVIVAETCRRAKLNPASIQREIVGIRAGEKMHEGLISEDEVYRTEERPEMFVVHSMDEFSRRDRVGWGDVDTSELHSHACPMLSRDAILDLLNRADVWRQHRL